jgi:cystathionine beta-lyase/cystathionine gamma-synthase
VLHSTTKYLNGHSDMVGGMLVTSRDDLAERLGFLQNASGAVPGPMDCWLALRGTKTLELRMERHLPERSPHRGMAGRPSRPHGRVLSRPPLAPAA